MEEKKINERIIRFIGSACIPNDLELGQEVKFEIKGDIVETKDKDNQDGTKDKIFIAKIITAENA